MFLKILSVFGIGLLEVLGAVPAGFALKLHPVLICSVTIVSSITGVLIIILVGGKLRDWLLRKFFKNAESGRAGKLKRIWDKYGVVGLGLLAPLLTGPPLGAAIGVALGANNFKLVLWMLAGIAIWSIGLTLIGTMGIKIFG